MENEKRELTPLEKSKRMKFIIIAVLAGSLVLLAVCAAIPSLSKDLFGGGGRREEITVDPSKLADTKEEDFDIFEYDEYLKYDRTVYLFDRGMGTTVSVKADKAEQYGDAFVMICDILDAINRGDVDAYNSMVNEPLRRTSFTQQQIYGIQIQTYSKKTMVGKNNLEYIEYVYKVKYKIHENNGTYRNDILSDASRDQYFVINDSSGEMLVMDIIFVGS